MSSIINPYATKKPPVIPATTSLVADVDLDAKGVIWKKSGPPLAKKAKTNPEPETKETTNFSYEEPGGDAKPAADSGSSTISYGLLSANLSFSAGEILFIDEIISSRAALEQDKSIRTTGVVVASVGTEAAAHMLLREASLEQQAVTLDTIAADSLAQLIQTYEQHKDHVVYVQAPLDQAHDAGTLVMALGEWHSTTPQPHLQARILRSANGTHMELYREAILARRHCLQQQRDTRGGKRGNVTALL